MRRATRILVAALIALAALAGASPAWAAPTTEVVQGKVLRLVSTADWVAASELLPGQPVQWDVAVSADSPDPGKVWIGVSAVGEAELTVDITLCAQEWIASMCPGGATVMRSSWSIPRDGVEVPLAEIPDTEVAHFRLSIALAASSEGSTEVRVHARGAGESAILGPGGGSLAVTGQSPLVRWVLVGGIALIAGGVALVAMRLRRRGDRGETS